MTKNSTSHLAGQTISQLAEEPLETQAVVLGNVSSRLCSVAAMYGDQEGEGSCSPQEPKVSCIPVGGI